MCPDPVEEQHISRDELQGGIHLTAGHKVVFVLDGGHETRKREPQPDDEDVPDVEIDAPPEEVEGGLLDVQIVSVDGTPQAYLEVEVNLPDGSLRGGKTDAGGLFRVIGGVPAEGECTLEVPDVPPSAAESASTEGRLPYRAGMKLQIGTRPVVELPPRVRRGTLTGAHFETNKTFLLPSALRGMRALCALYESYKPAAVIISGHTDTVGAADYNLALSVERADAIAAYVTDNVDGWLPRYAPQPHSAAWGVREDQYMLASLPQGGAPYYTDTVDGIAGPNTDEAYRRFQEEHGLAQSKRGDDDTRRALITDYMAYDGTSLPQGSQVLTHGCGLSHPAVDTGPGVASLENRRVEIFLFESAASPAPQTPCPEGGCAEYPQWVQQSGLTVDLDQPPATLVATVTSAEGGAPLDGVNVHAAGPTPRDEVTVSGTATFTDRVPGAYKLIADKDGFDSAAADVEAAAGATVDVPLVLKPRPPMRIARLGARPVTDAEAKKLGG